MRVELPGATLILGDCLEVMPSIEAGSIDLVLCDLPYGTTQNKWDSVLPLDRLWEEYWRLLKPAGAAVLTASQPFTSALVMSAREEFRYDWCWRKSNSTGHLNAKKMPLRQHEDILVFGRGQITYNPQLFAKPSKRRAQRSVKSKGSYGNFDEGVFRSIPDEMGYPRSVLDFNTAYHEREAGLHPAQKPVPLFEYLVRTYSNPGETVLDNTMGSGTTGLACLRSGRRFIGIESDPAHFETARTRLLVLPGADDDARLPQPQLSLLDEAAP